MGRMNHFMCEEGRAYCVTASSCVLIWFVAIASGCTSLPGHAHRESGAPNGSRVAFQGLSAGTSKSTIVFYTHGMGKTDGNFDKELIQQGQRLLPGGVWSDVGDPTPVQLPQAWFLRGEGLDCSGSGTSCFKSTFGTLRIRALRTPEKIVTFYSYYWNEDAEIIQHSYGLSCDEGPEYCDKNEASGWLEARLNRWIKNEVVVDGFSDATLYAGGAGYLLRAGVQAAICLSLKHALFGAIPNGKCTASDLLPDPARPDVLDRVRLLDIRLVAKSLGSRLVFDTLTPFDEVAVLEEKAMTYAAADSARNGSAPHEEFTRDIVRQLLPTTASQVKLSPDTQIKEAYAGIELKKAIGTSLSEVYLLANQLPLLGLSRIQAGDRQRVSARDSVYCVYVSADPTCDTSPALRMYLDGSPRRPVTSGPSLMSFTRGVRAEKLKIIAFKDVNDLLGFRAGSHFSKAATELADFVEIRHQNASVFLWLLALPQSAHAKEDEHKDSAQLIWCGGVVEPDGAIQPGDCAR